MTLKQWNAAIMLAGQALVGCWLTSDALGGLGLQRSAAQVSRMLLWAILVMVVFNIVATLLVTILIGVVRREVLKDEASDERDKLVHMKSMRNAYFALALGAGCSLLLLALSFNPVALAYALFSALMLAGAIDSASQLYYYRVG